MNLGAAELITLAILGLLIFGPRKLPEMARAAGKMLRELRSVTQELKLELEAGLEAENADQPKSSPGGDLGDAQNFPRPGPR